MERKPYTKLFKEFEKFRIKDKDTEMVHVTQDKIYKKFIKDIASKKFKKLEDIQDMAKLINKKVVKYDKGLSNRWYA